MDLISRHHRAVATGMRAERALTLVELLVVILIIATLALVGLPAFLGQQEKAQDSWAKTTLSTAYKALRQVMVFEHDGYPAEGQLVSTLNHDEPTIEFVAGKDYLEKKVSVERVSKDEVVLRTRSASGHVFRWRSSSSGEERVWAADVESGAPGLNLWKYPSFEIEPRPSGTVAHNIYGDNILEQSTDWASSGTRSLHWKGTGSNSAVSVYLRIGGYPNQTTRWANVEEGKFYTASFDVNAITPPPKEGLLELHWQLDGDDAAGSPVSEPVQIQPGLQRLAISGTAPAGAKYARVQIHWPQTGPRHLTASDALDIYVDSVRFSEGTDTDYFDGSFPNASWLGTPQQSPSEREGMDETPVGGWKSW